MAYAYPSVEHLPEASSASLEIRPSKEPFRKNSDTSTDVFSEFKVCTWSAHSAAGSMPCSIIQ